MSNHLRAKAIPRQDSSNQDGIHLMWIAPNEAGYSVHGFDIQRRDSNNKFEQICYTLTTIDFSVLHTELRVSIPFGGVSLQSSICPRGIGQVPDEPYQPESDKICIDFKSMPKGKFPNPRMEQGLSFKVSNLAHDKMKYNVKYNKYTYQQGLDKYHGLYGGERMEISLDTPSDYFALECYIPKSESNFIVYNDAGEVLEIKKVIEGSSTAQMYYFHHANIKSVVVEVPQNNWLLLNTCYHSIKGGCSKFLQPGLYPNPYSNKGFKLESFGQNGRKLKLNKVANVERFTGLNVPSKLHITPNSPVKKLTINFVHFSDSPEIELIGNNGKILKNIKTDAKQGKEFSKTVSSKAVIKEVRLKSRNGETLLLSVCPIIKLDDTKNKAIETENKYISAFYNAQSLNHLNSSGLDKQEDCRLYIINFKRMHHYVRMEAGYGAYMLIAFSQGKAVYSEIVPTSTTPSSIILENKFIDKLHLYTKVELKHLKICLEEDKSFEEEEKEWSTEAYLVKGLQLPLKSFNTLLNNNNDEDNLAQSRMIGAEVFDATAFRKMAELMNTTGKDPDKVTPMEFFTRTKERVEDPPIDINTWPYGISTVLKPEWRRALGFGFLDKDGNLTVGNAYDYRISGYFRRRDIEEELLSFRTIPVGLKLPRQFRMNGIALTTLTELKVTHFPDIPNSALQKTARKGILIESRGSGNYSLKINLAEPVTDIVLELESSVTNNFRYEAESSDFFPGLGSLFSDPVPQEERVHLTFTDAVTEICFYGSALIYGFRLNPVPFSEDPNKIIKKSVILYNVPYQDSPKPVAPSFLGTSNLQQLPIVGNAETIISNPRNDMGFKLKWIPPLNGATPIPYWPEDLNTFPPFDALGFHLERRRVDIPDSFMPIDGEKSDMLFMGSRQGASDPQPVSFGVDILKLFPQVRTLKPPIDLFIETQDVLLSSLTNTGVPGGLYQYRIFAVDVLGRKSSTPTNGSIVRLEKRVAPPQPGAPNMPTNGDVGFAGVKVSVLQESDPELSEDDQTLLGDSSNAVVLEWGWSPEQRHIDPYAREFRVYWESNVPDMIYGSLTGSATLVGGYYEMQANLQQSVMDNQYSGRYIRAGEYSFKIKSHSGGSNITIRLEKYAADPIRVPEQGDFVLSAVLDGENVRPAKWQTRSVVVPITSQDNYQHIFRDEFTLTAVNPKKRIWVGVSSADDQYYIADELTASATNGNRSGNESSIAVGYAQARFYGRPTFNVPPPLENVPEIVTKEPVGTLVELELDLPSIYGSGLTIPAGHKIILEQISSAVLLNMIGTTPTDQIEVELPDGTNPTYTLANPGDHNKYLSQIRDGITQAIEGKFIMNFLIRYKNKLDKLWSRTIATPVNYGIHSIALKSDPERHFFQIKLVDEAGHISETGAIFPRIIRTCSLRVPDAPSIVAESSNDNTVQVNVEFRDQFDLKWLILFAHESNISDPPDDATLKKAQVLRLPNRMDLYPDDGIRLRLMNGSILEPRFSKQVDLITLDEDIRKSEENITLNLDKSVALWAILMTRDGIASRAMGPIMVTTGPILPVAPVPTYLRNGNRDDLSWLAPAISCRVRIERNIEGNWNEVSPWLPEGSINYSVKGPAVDRSYRLRLKASRGPDVSGTPLIINEP